MNIILKQLLLIHKGATVSKIKSTLLLAAISSPIPAILDWYKSNSEYVLFVLLAIVIDHALGSWLHASKKRFDLKKNLMGLITKTTLAVCVGVLCEGISNIVGDTFMTGYMEATLRSAVFLYPALSALGNCFELSNGKFPPSSVMTIFKSFNREKDGQN